MPENISINLNDVDLEISQIDKQIADLNKEREEWIIFKNQSVKLASKLRHNGIHSQVDGFELGLGISDFLLEYLKKGNIKTTVLIHAWASYCGRKPDELSNNVSNALARLKVLDKADNEVDPRGKRYGASWFLKEKELQV